MWKNLVLPAGPQMTIRRIRITYWIPTATSTNSEYVILFDFPLQKWFQWRASLLHCYVHCCLFNFMV